MDFVTENIAIGDGPEAEDEEHLLSLEITHVLNVHPMKKNYGELIYERMPWHDERDLGMLDEALNFMERAIGGGGKIIVICGGGVERSPTTVLAYLHRKEGLSIEEAYRILKSKRPVCDINLAWLDGWLDSPPREPIKYKGHFWD